MRQPRFGAATVRLAAAMIVLTTGWTMQASAAEWFVSPAGRDTNPGTLERPFATIARAQQVARAARRDGNPITVTLRAGTYELPETLVFTEADSGTATSPVVFRAFAGERAILSGGTRLDLKWEPHRDGIFRAATPPGFATDQLFVNGVRQPMARYPNVDPAVRIFNGFAADAISPGRVARWAHPAGGYIHAMHEAMWGDMHWRITGKDAQGRLLYDGGWQNNRPSGMHPECRFVENLLEELDAPGEWFHDATARTLYFAPPPGLDLKTAVFEGVRLRQLIELKGTEGQPVRHVTFRGLTFRLAARTFMENSEPLLRSDWTTYRGGAVLLTGTEDCTLDDCFLDQLGGNAVFVNRYNRRATIRGCRIEEAGANGVAFVGDPRAVRNGIGWKERNDYATIDRTPGPRSNEYPADCLVDDCLITRTGRVEKQTAPVQIAMARSITVRHCSLYDVPRAGVNIGDGCWGGHLIEFCDIFDTVKETGDHGSFNSWGRDRFWKLGGVDLDRVTLGPDMALPLLDMVTPTVMRNNRWRCDHGWDIDLDDGSSNYILRDNLCLNGGIKLREGFYRVVENNVMVNNGFHPHVWFAASQDVVRCNILFTDHYLPAGGMPPPPWGREMDRNLVHRPGVSTPLPARALAELSGRDALSLVADAQFVDPARGDYRVKDDSPALELGFVNFPMDRFGVRKPELRAIARTPQFPGTAAAPPAGTHAVGKPASGVTLGAKVRGISGAGDRSAYGLPGEYGVLILEVPADSRAARLGLQKNDVILGCGGRRVSGLADLLERLSRVTDDVLELEVRRDQKTIPLRLR